MSRIAKLRDRLPANADGAIVSSITNREYLSSFLSGDAGMLLVLRDEAYFIIDSRYIEVAKRDVKGATVVLQENTYEQVTELCRKHGVKTLLAEQEISVAEYNAFCAGIKDVEVVCDGVLSDIIRKLRAIKDAHEVQMICDAQTITDKAFLEICDFIKPGRTEKQIAAELEYYMRRAGADGMAFETIVASGPNSSMPHAVPTDREVREGDFITMDYGALLGGYCSDMTRTVALGKLSDEQYDVYETVLKAHLDSMAAARPGVTGKELDSIARVIIDTASGGIYKGTFGHSLGHSLGLDIHEWPNATFKREDVLPAGTIMTIEPGIYLEGRFGVRIENMILITEDGYKNLTSSERKLITL